MNHLLFNMLPGGPPDYNTALDVPRDRYLFIFAFFLRTHVTGPFNNNLYISLSICLDKTGGNLSDLCFTSCHQVSKVGIIQASVFTDHLPVDTFLPMNLK